MESYRSLPITSIRVRNNPRSEIGSVDELAASIKKKGVLETLIVRPSKSNGHFDLVAGGRRLMAAKAAGLTEVPVRVMVLTDEEALEVAITENLQRENLPAMDEARGFADLRKKLSVSEIAGKLGRTERYVKDRLRFLTLVPAAQKFIEQGVITTDHAVLLARLTPEMQRKALDPDERALITYEGESLAFDAEPRKGSSEGVKARSVREFAAWVERHVKLTTKMPKDVIADLFPATAAVIAKPPLVKKGEKEVPAKLIPLTRDYTVASDVRDGTRVFGERSWRRSDGKAGSKKCDSPEIGVVVVGDGQGESFPVCTNKKKCKVHWLAEQKASAARKKGGGAAAQKADDRWKKQQEEDRKRREAEELLDKQWEAGLPKLLAAVAERVRKMPVGPSGLLGQIVLGGAGSIYGRHSNIGQAAFKKFPDGSKAEDVVRKAAFGQIAEKLVQWRARADSVKLLKALNVKVEKPAKPAPEPEKEKAKA